MSVYESSTYKSLIKLSNSINSLICSFEYLDYHFFNSFLLSIDKKKYSSIIILIKEDSKKCYNYSHTSALQILSNLNQHNVVVKTNSDLNFTGILINDSELFIPKYNNKKEIIDIILSHSNSDIMIFKNKFDSILGNCKNDFSSFYNSTIDIYIDNALSIDKNIINYIDDVKSNKTRYKNSCFYSNSEVHLNSSDIPQFSSFEDGALILPSFLKVNNNPGYTFIEIGKLLCTPGKKDGAYTKYGENQSKLAELLGLVYITHNPRHVYLSDIGSRFLSLSEDNQRLFLKYQIYNMPVIKCLFNLCFNENISISDFILNVSELSTSTAVRRSSNIKKLIKILLNNCDKKVADIFNNCLYLPKSK